MMMWNFWARRLLELTAALMLTYLVIQLSVAVGQRQKDVLPASAWFAVNEVYVPDHAEGSNPFMIYDRSIRENVRGFWIAEVQRVGSDGLFQNECSGFGTSDYDTTEVIVDNTVSWEWFIGRPCAVPPGRYRIRVSYTLKRAGWPEKEVLAFSNTFTVE